MKVLRAHHRHQPNNREYKDHKDPESESSLRSLRSLRFEFLPFSNPKSKITKSVEGL
jgi:hypothetical protein